MKTCRDCKDKIEILEKALQVMATGSKCINCKANKICDEVGDCVSAHIKFAKLEIKKERENNEKK